MCVCSCDVTQEHRLEIDARSGTFQAFETFGQQLLENQHYASDEVQARLGELRDARQQLEEAWVQRRARLDQCLEGQLFNRDCDQAETWMAAREATLRDEVDGGQSSALALQGTWLHSRLHACSSALARLLLTVNC